MTASSSRCATSVTHAEGAPRRANSGSEFWTSSLSCRTSTSPTGPCGITTAFTRANGNRPGIASRSRKPPTSKLLFWNQKLEKSVKRPQPDAESKSVYIVRIRFCDTDLMGIVHHAKYLEYFEAGRVEYMHRRGVEYVEWTKRGIHLPVVQAA